MDSANLNHMTIDPATTRSAVLRWFMHDIFFIAMLVLALVGVIFRLPVSYWVLLMPVFAVITIAEGWSHFTDRGERLGLVIRVALNWLALLLAIYLLSGAGVAGVMNANAGSLAMMTLLALGTFVAGVQGRVWQIVAIGCVLFLAVPALGWLDQSPLLLATGAVAIVALGGFGWWITERRAAGVPADIVAGDVPSPPNPASSI